MIFVVITVCVIVWLVAWFTLQFVMANDVPREKIVMIEDRLRTGDIVGTGNLTIDGWVVNTLTGSLWTHTGVIWRDTDDKVYVIEITKFSKDRELGLVKVPFSAWYYKHRKDRRCHVRLVGEPIDSDVFMEHFKEYEGKRTHIVKLGWYRYFVPSIFRAKRKNYTCFEMTLHLLKKIGVVKGDIEENNYYGGDIVWGRIPTVNGYRYQEPVMF